MPFLMIFLGFMLLVIGGDFLVRAAVGLSFKLKISKFVIGMTVVSFATSIPELLVSLEAALSGSPDIAINNIVGSNIANIGLVLGITAIVGGIAVDKTFYKLNWPVMMIFSMALYYFLSNDNQLVLLEGLLLFSGLILFLIILLNQAKKDIYLDEVDESLAIVSFFKISIWLLIGGITLYYGSQWLVDGAVKSAKFFGVSEAIISVTVIAIGTSVPELAASVMAAIKKERSISLGNLIGSNIFNIGSVLGITSMIKSIQVIDQRILNVDIVWMIVFAAMLLPLILVPKQHQISRLKGFTLTIGYGIFLVVVFA